MQIFGTTSFTTPSTYSDVKLTQILAEVDDKHPGNEHNTHSHTHTHTHTHTEMYAYARAKGNAHMHSRFIEDPQDPRI